MDTVAVVVLAGAQEGLVQQRHHGREAPARLQVAVDPRAHAQELLPRLGVVQQVDRRRRVEGREAGQRLRGVLLVLDAQGPRRLLRERDAQHLRRDVHADHAARSGPLVGARVVPRATGQIQDIQARHRPQRPRQHRCLYVLPHGELLGARVGVGDGIILSRRHSNLSHPMTSITHRALPSRGFVGGAGCGRPALAGRVCPRCWPGAGDPAKLATSARWTAEIPRAAAAGVTAPMSAQRLTSRGAVNARSHR